MLKVVIINKSDSTGGAAVVSRRLMEALRDAGVDARMLVAEKRHPSPYIERCASPLSLRRSFLTERLKIFMANGRDRETLFKIDTASDGVDLWRHPWVKDADIICLNWVNQGVLSLSGLKKLISLGKPIVWTMHDMWCFTGICHHAGKCTRFMAECGECPLLKQRGKPDDLSHNIWEKKLKVYRNGHITFVAVSNWLAGLAEKSSLLRDADLRVIPNAFNLGMTTRRKIHDGLVIVFGAARLDDPIKGLPILMKATEVIRQKYPRLAAEMILLTFGSMKNPDAFADCAINHRHLGPLHGEEAVRDAYASGDIVVSSSLYETLPGTMVEGQAYGCIPVCFDRGGQRDIITHKETGYLARWDDNPDICAANLAEGIVWAADAPKNIRSVMRHSVEKKFSAGAVADAYIRLFHSLSE